MMPSTVGLQGVGDLVGVEGDQARARAEHVPSLHHQRLALGGGIAEPDLDVLGGQLAHHQLVLLAQVLVEREGHLVTGDAAGARRQDAAEAEGGDLGGAAADVDDHVGARLQRVDAAADGAGDGLGHQLDAADPRLLHGLDEGSALQRRGSRRDSDGRAGAEPLPGVSEGSVEDGDDEAAGGLQVRDDAVADGAHRGEPDRRPADQLARLVPHPHRGAGMAVDPHRHHRWLVEHDPPARLADHRVGRPEVDPEARREEHQQRPRLRLLLLLAVPPAGGSRSDHPASARGGKDPIREKLDE